MVLALAALTLVGGALPSMAAQSEDSTGIIHTNSVEALQLATWVTASRDNGVRPFIVIDKVTAEVLIFDTAGLLQGVTPALLGIAKGDDATPGIGDKESERNRACREDNSGGALFCTDRASQGRPDGSLG